MYFLELIVEPLFKCYGEVVPIVHSVRSGDGLAPPQLEKPGLCGHRPLSFAPRGSVEVACAPRLTPPLPTHPPRPPRLPQVCLPALRHTKAYWAALAARGVRSLEAIRPPKEDEMEEIAREVSKAVAAS